MNTNSNNINQALATFIDRLTEMSDHAVQFGSDIMPEVLRQWLLSAIIRSWGSLICCTVGMIVTICMFIVGIRLTKRIEDTDDASMTRFVMVCALLILVGCLGTCIYTSVMNLFEIHITPYVYIVKHLKDLVN